MKILSHVVLIKLGKSGISVNGVYMQMRIRMQEAKEEFQSDPLIIIFQFGFLFLFTKLFFTSIGPKKFVTLLIPVSLVCHGILNLPTRLKDRGPLKSLVEKAILWCFWLNSLSIFHMHKPWICNFFRWYHSETELSILWKWLILICSMTVIHKDMQMMMICKYYKTS